MSLRSVRLVTSLLCAIPLLVSCGSSSGSKSDAASGGSGGAGSTGKGGQGGGGAAGSGAAGNSLDASTDATNTDTSLDASADGTESACPIDGAVVADPFAGVWRGDQQGITFTLTNSGGCTTWVAVANGTACGFCGGTYAVTGPTSGTSTVSCSTGCGGGAHTDTGTLTLSGCSVTYNYDFGNGSNSWTGSRIADANGNICAQVDAGAD